MNIGVDRRRLSERCGIFDTYPIRLAKITDVSIISSQSKLSTSVVARRSSSLSRSYCYAPKNLEAVVISF